MRLFKFKLANKKFLVWRKNLHKHKALFINDVILFWVFPDPHPPPSTNIIIWQTPCPIASSSSSKLSSFLIWKCNKYNSFFDFCSSHEHNIMGKATFHSKYLEIKCKIKEFHLQSFFEGPPALYHLQTCLTMNKVYCSTLTYSTVCFVFPLISYK